MKTVLTAVDQLPEKAIHRFRFLLTFVLSTQFFPQRWRQSSLACMIIIWSIQTVNFCQVSVRSLLNLQMLYIVSLLVTYDTMVSLICFFFALFLIHSFGLHRGVWVSRSSGRARYGAGAPGTRASESELAVPNNTWELSRPEREPVSPASAGRYWPTEGESLCPLHRQAGTDPLGERACVPCIGRQVLTHWATREALFLSFFFYFFFFFLPGVRTLSIRSTHFDF